MAGKTRLGRLADVAQMYGATAATIERIESAGIADLGVWWNLRLRTTAGRCHFVPQPSGRGLVPVRIELNPKGAGDGAFLLDTILHEAAHAMDALVFGGNGHGRTWKRCARALGADPSRCYDSAEAPPALQAAARRASEKKVVAICSKCGIEVRRRRALSWRNGPWRHGNGCGGELRKPTASEVLEAVRRG